MTHTMQFSPGYAHLSSQEKLSMNLFVLVGLGVGYCAGSLLMGWIQDKPGVSNRTTLATAWLISALSCGFLVYYILGYSFTQARGLLLCTLQGVCDGGLNVVLDCINGFQYDSQRTPFSVNKLVFSFFIFVFGLIIANLEDKQSQLWFASFQLGYAGVAFVIAICWFKFK